MDRSKNFLKVSRENPRYRPVTRRLKDYAAVEKLPEESGIISQASRCMDCGVPFCHGYGCPVSNVTPEWNELVARKKWRDALELLVSTSNFPEFTARLCPALCEAACVLGIHFEPVTIRQIELYVIEKGFEKGWLKPRPPASRNGKKVAVVGSGPAGLAVADDLNRTGCSVTVYDGEQKPGGILRYGIPDFKLEKWLVDRRIGLMEAEGIQFETGVWVGKDLSPAFLRKRFDAVCLACGAREPRDLPVPGRNLKGVHFAMDFLRHQNRVLAGETRIREALSAKGKHVVVIGGGDTGSDCIGTSLRQKAKSVTQIEIMPKPPKGRTEHMPWPDWPVLLRTSSSHKEGCKRMWNVATRQFKGRGKVKELECHRVVWETDEKGRPTTFVAKDGSDFALKADLVLLAMGFTGAEKNALAESLGIKFDGRGGVMRKPNGMTSVPGVFVAGDMSKGASLIVRAIADGKEVASMIHRNLFR